MKLGLELMAAVSADRVNAKWEPVHYMVYEINGIGLGMALVYFQGSDASGVIHRRVLKTAYTFVF